MEESSHSSIVFETERLRVREFKLSDFDAVHAYTSDPDVSRYQSWGPNTPEETKAFLEASIAQKFSPSQSATWAVTLKTTGQVIGSCAMFIKESQTEAEIGFSFARAFWNAGYATETLKGLIKFAIETQKFKSLLATANVRNADSRRVLEKAGFVQTHIEKNHMILRDGPRDTAFYKFSPLL